MDFHFPSQLPEELHDCDVCPRDCHADRFSETRGYCGCDALFTISSVCIHKGEEPAISGSDGICNVFFSGCNLQCVYCQNWQISDRKSARSQLGLPVEEILPRITSILDKGINWLGFVSPSHQVLQMKQLIRDLNLRGYHPKIVFNTNAYDKPEMIRSLEGIVDVYLPDFKYMNRQLAKKYSDAGDYPEVAAAALKEMYRQKGAALHLDEQGRAESGIVIRHLVLPGNIENSLEVLRYIAQEISPKVHISLMSQYYPTPRVRCVPDLDRILSASEYNLVTDEMEHLGMHKGWIQEPESAQHYHPDFDQLHPFEKTDLRES
jgi:putative pyruvate formate lyase activating enzyme